MYRERYMYICVHIYLYIYIYRERERCAGLFDVFDSEESFCCFCEPAVLVHIGDVSSGSHDTHATCAHTDLAQFYLFLTRRSLFVVQIEFPCVELWRPEALDCRVLIPPEARAPLS